MRNSTRKRPWLAVFLATVGTGFGHLYLRRWRRALGWVVLTIAAAVLLVPGATVEAFGTGGGFALFDIAPLLVVSGLSALDAYRLAVLNNYRVRTSQRGAEATRPCPECGRPLDDDLEFCHWCSTRLPETEAADDTGGNEEEGSERYPLE
jgi:hypothetical protein